MLSLSVTFVTCRRAVYECVEKWEAEVLAGEVYNQVHTRDVDLYTMLIPDFATDRHFGGPQDEIRRYA